MYFEVGKGANGENSKGWSVGKGDKDYSRKRLLCNIFTAGRWGFTSSGRGFVLIIQDFESLRTRPEVSKLTPKTEEILKIHKFSPNGWKSNRQRYNRITHQTWIVHNVGIF